MSIHNPLAAGDRSRISTTMVAKEIEFVGVPLGPRVDGVSLNGLAAGTGGAIVSLAGGDKIDELIRDINASLATPVLYPTSFELGSSVAEAFPTVLPPLRGDAATLVMRSRVARRVVHGRGPGDQPVKFEKTEQVSARSGQLFPVGA